jgi:5-methylcytosine-specific restriction endonuclease McrBC regulatory subunit McrC
MRFGGVSVVPIASKQVPGVIYDRLSGRYREIHAWCRFFIDQMTLLNESGKVNFQGFRLNMFELFERFVFCVFKQASRKWTGVRIDKTRFPLDTKGRVGILPDVLIRARSFLTIADAKYKLTQDATGKHPDLYQVIAYSMALGLIEANHRPQALLVYPASERTTVFEGDLHILTSAKGESELSVRTLWLDLTSDNVIRNSISKVDSALSEAAHTALVSIRPSVPQPEDIGSRYAG